MLPYRNGGKAGGETISEYKRTRVKLIEGYEWFTMMRALRYFCEGKNNMNELEIQSKNTQDIHVFRLLIAHGRHLQGNRTHFMCM